MSAPRYTAADVRKAIKGRYCAPEWAAFFEVANGTGSLGRNYADALAMNLFPSRGLRLHGFEIKVSRSDWLHELKQPHKSDAIQRYCDHWWIVTPADIVKEGELPPTWGHLVLKGNGLNCVVKAPQLERATWEPAFLAALLRRAHEAMISGIRDAVNDAMRDERAAIGAEITRRVDSELSYRAREATETIKKLDTIKEKCGIPFGEEKDFTTYFDASAFAQAVGFVYQAGIFESYGGVQTIARTARTLADAIDKVAPPKQVAANRGNGA